MWFYHEPDYFNVIRFLVENGRLPERDDFESTERGTGISQATQPPLFMYLSYPIVGLLDDGSNVPPGFHPSVICEGGASPSYPYMLTTDYNWPPYGAAAAGYALRLMNLTFAIGTMLIVYRIARQIVPKNLFAALVAAAFVGFQPNLFTLGISISNESLLLMISSANLYFALRLVSASELRPGELVGLILTALLGPLTKTNGYVLIAGTGFVLVYLILHHMRSHARARSTRLLVIGTGLLLVGILAISTFNYVQYGSIIGRYQDRLAQTVDNLSELSIIKLKAMLRDTYYSYSGPFPFQREKLLWAYTAGTLVGICLFIGRIGWTIVRQNRARLTMDIVLLVYGLASIVLVMLRVNIVDDLEADKIFAPVRYYISGLPALLVMMALGWQSLIPARLPSAITKHLGDRRTRFYARWVVWNWPGLLWALVWLFIVVWNTAEDVRNHPARDLMTSAELDKLITQQNITPAVANAGQLPDVPNLRAYDYRVGADGVVYLTAYMEVQETPALNYIARMVLGDNAGGQAICEIIPHNGHYATTRWESGQIVPVPIAIPNCADSGERLSAPLTLTLDWLPVNADGELITPTADTAHTIIINSDLPRAQSCLTNLGIFDGTFQVVKYTGPTSTTAGSVYLPAVNWYVRTNIEKGDLSRFYVITHSESAQSYTCTGIPRLGDYRIDRWKRGEVIYFDQCWLEIPSDAPSGEYTVAVGMVDNQTGDYLPITSGQENSSPGGLLNIATLVVR